MRELRTKVELNIQNGKLLVTTELLNGFNELVIFLGKFPQSQLTIENCQITGANEVTPHYLSISGNIAQTWPIKGFHSDGLKNIVTLLELRRDNEFSPIDTSWKFAGVLTVATTNVVLTGGVVEGALVELKLGQNPELKFSLAQITGFSIPGMDVTDTVPNIPLFREIVITDLKLLFGFATLDRSTIKVKGTIAENWNTVKNIFTLQNLVFHYGADYLPGPNGRLRKGYQGHLEGQIAGSNLYGRVDFQDAAFAEMAVTTSTKNNLPGLKEWAKLTNETALVEQLSKAWPEFDIEKMKVSGVQVMFNWNSGELNSILLTTETPVWGVLMNLDIRLPGCEFGGGLDVDLLPPNQKIDGLLGDLVLPSFCSGLSLAEVNLAIWPKQGFYSFCAQTKEWSVVIDRYTVLFKDFEMEWHKTLEGKKSTTAFCLMVIRRGDRVSGMQLKIDFIQSRYSFIDYRTGSKIGEVTIQSNSDLLNLLKKMIPPKIVSRSNKKITIRPKRQREEPIEELNTRLEKKQKQKK